MRYHDVLYYQEKGVAGLLVSYTQWVDADDCYRNSVSHLPLSTHTRSIMNAEAGQQDWEIVFSTEPCLPLRESGVAMAGRRAGGQMAYLGDHKFALTTGDYGWQGLDGSPAYTQLDTGHYGKVIEVDLLNGTARAISTGHRNPLGILVDSGGQLWLTEHGPRGGDELNKVVDGGNYGWPEASLGTTYSRQPLPTADQYGRHDRHIAPTYAWLPSVGISAMTRVRGFDRSWDGDFLVGSLKGQSLFRLRIKQDRVIFAEQIPMGDRVRDVHQHTDERVVVWTDSRQVVFLAPDGF